MKKPVNPVNPVKLLASLIAGAALTLSASAAFAHASVDRHGDYRAHRHAQPRHAAPVRHAYRHDHRHDYRHRHRDMPVRAYRDRDGDGVANRYDRAPRNPYRY